MTRIAPLLLLAALAPAAPKDDYHDEVHPRDPETPLEISYRPYSCALCEEEGRIEDAGEPFTMLRRPVPTLVRELGLEPGWLVIATPHFRILTNIEATVISLDDGVFVRADLERLRTIFPKLVIRKPPHYTKLTAHQRAHLYHIRVERVFSHFAALTENTEPYLGMLAPYQLFLFDGYAEHHKLADGILGHADDEAGVRHHDREKPNFMAFTTCEAQVATDRKKADRQYSNHVVHNLAHNLVDGHGNYYRESWAWLEEGVAHYYERRDNPRQNTFCTSEGKAPEVFYKPDWEYTIYNIVRRDRDVPLSRWCEKLLPAELHDLEHGLCWSIARWMIEIEPVRFTMMLRKHGDYETKPNAAACIEYAFGAGPGVIHQRWRKYVLEHYKRKR